VRGEIHILAASASGKESHRREHWIGPMTWLDMVTRKIHTSCHELKPCDHPVAGNQLTSILETKK
jgi:hypothetical protein